MAKVAIVTGGTSGIGKATALALQKVGFTVYEFSRHEPAAGVRHVTADITDEAAVSAAVSQVWEETGRIDLLVNNAGFGISGAVEFTDTERARQLFDVDFFGAVRVTRCVLPMMRRQGGGRIMQISSVAAPVPIPFQAYYSAAKAALNAYTLALANEVRPFGITVCAVQPGDIRTGFTAARKKETQGDEAYNGRIARSVARMERDEQNGMDPETVGNFVARVAQNKRVKPVYTVGVTYRLVTVLVRLLPTTWLNRLIGRLYAR